MLGVCFFSGIVFAQIPGPVPLTGAGGAESNFTTPLVGTGGTISTFNTYTIHAFTASGTFVPPNGVTQIDVLVVGGGGGGGGDRYGGGGGGAGGVIWQTGVAVQPSFSVTVGAGGAGGVGITGTNGGSSNVAGYTADGGGGGGRSDNGEAGLAGGSGGGGGARTSNPATIAGGAATSGQGNAGGAGQGTSNDAQRGGGGGGASAAGGIGTTGPAGVGGAGGAGADYSALLGTSVGVSGVFAGGGGGGSRTGTGGAGGTGGGGASSATPTAGTVNTGGGGGGLSGTVNGGSGAAGGSGVVVIRYTTPTVASDYRVHSFTTDTSFTSPAGISTVDVVVVGGGGAGGGDRHGGGGGGAGGLQRNQSQAVTAASSYTVDIGPGGTGTTASGGNGTQSSFDALVANGGGGGARGDNPATNGAAGGSGGGGGGGSSNTTGGTGSQGSAGGGGVDGGNGDDRGGGGGGAAAVGGGGSTTTGGAGGNGYDYSQLFGTGFGVSGAVAGGGGGGKRTTGAGGIAGAGGGGAGGITGVGSAATANTGGGGGGVGGTTDALTGSNGGSGLVVLRYRPGTMEITDQLLSPFTVQSGAAFSQNIVVEILNANGSPVVGVNVTAAISFGTGTLGGTVTEATDVNGQAIFDNLNITGATGTHRLRFTATGSSDLVETNNFTVLEYHFEISHALTVGVCAATTPVTISVFDQTDTAVLDFTGTVTISNGLNLGDYSLDTGGGTFANLTANDGTAQYTFVDADDGVVILDFTSATTGTYVFDANSGSIDTDNYAIDLDVLACEFRISHDASAGSCAPDQITFGVYDSAGNVVTGYVGNATLTTSGVTGGNWTNTTVPSDANGTLDNGTAGDGAATYAFVTGDAGTIILNFRGNAGTANFNVTATGVTAPVNPYDANLVIASCAFRISHDTAASVCAVEQITISVVDGSGNLVAFVGNISLSATGVTGGNWTATNVPANANGTLDNGAAGDSAATYTFVAADAGDIILNYQAAAGTANFSAVAAGVTAPANPYDPDLVITTCTFRVTHGGTTDVCSMTAVTLTLVNNLGVTITNYTGTVNLSTTTGYGTWSESGSENGTLIDGVAEDGNATYQFDLADAGVVTLNFLHASDSGTVNINVSDGTTLDPRNFANAYDLNITVAVCTFEISHSEAVTACEVEPVIITVRNSLGGVATAYTGTMTLGSNSNHGNWLLNDGDGTLDDTAGDDNGVATYEFADSDNGVVILDFADPHGESVSLDAIDGDILVDGDFDPLLYVSSCLPDVVGSAACGFGASTSLTIPAQSNVVTQRGRMVLMSIAAATGAGPAVSAATFDGDPMTLIRRETTTSGEGSVVELWGILEASLPTAAGSYTGSYTGGAAGSGMCLIAVDEVKQEFPVADTPATSGPLNGTVGTASNAASTTITTTANNALVVMATNMDGTTFNNGRSYSSPVPTSFMVRHWGQSPSPVANPTANSGSRFAGSAGRHPTAGIVTMTETLSVNSPVYSQVVASFEPLIAGSPLASAYEPVTLFQTFAGSLSYRAVGNTMRTTYNEDAPTPLACNFVATATGSAATLTLPVGSTVEAAYLYWAGSGDDALDQVDDEVSFGITASEQTILADEIFLIDDVGNANDKDYFAAYRDVTGLVTGSGSYTLKDFEIQDGPPWSDTQACAGGWAMIVVYEHEDERLRVLNLFHGFQPFQNSSFTLVPRNFRMAAHDAFNNLPNGQVTHITLEGDETLNAVDENEGLGIQDAPDSSTFEAITSSLNPLGQEFNSTITRPVYTFDAGTGYYEFDSTGGLNGDGYEIDSPGPNASGGGARIGNSWGLDVDTHYIQGSGVSDILYPFGVLGSEAEQITTRYSAEGDLVMLISEVISITNFPLADIEVYKTQVGTFKVNNTGTYQIEVTNNGNGTVSGGYADGEIKVADILPAGMTFANASDVSGTGWTCNVTLNPGAFTCTYDIATTWTDGAIDYQLAADESLPLIDVDVQIGGSGFFPLLNNNAKNSVRVLHSDGDCPAAADGVIPDSTLCDRSPQFDNYNDLEGGNIDINDLDDKQVNNNNVDSITTVVRGVETNLSMNKFVNGILEEGEPGSYTLRVTNNGPDATTATITVTDTDPTGVDFDTQATGTGWSCSAPPGNLTCTYAGSLGVGASTDITVPVTVTGSGGYTVTNTATVAVGAFNFDTVAGNNSDTDITQITAAPVASQERFLMSVSSLGGVTTLGGLTNFEDDDYIIYDPVSDTATMYFDNSALGYNVNDADAVHLMKNGHIVISAADAGSTVGSNNLAFEPGDLVVYDPILQTARMLFDGSAVFAGAGNPAEVNITAAYVVGECELNPTPYNCSIIIAATPASGGSTLGGVAFTSADLIQYNLDTGVASLFFEGADYFDDVTDVTINGFYLRVDPSDANANINTLVLTANDSDDDTITAAATVGWDPETGTYFTRDDVTQIDIPGETTENLFLGDVELGIFEPADGTRTIDALHVIEDGYMGHFSITEVVAGDACTPTQIRISKHEGLTHTLDSDYFGSIQITTSTGLGNWAMSSGVGSLSNGTLNDGAATYTFVPGDAGDVVLTLTHTEAVGVGVNVSNRVASESVAHDPSLSFDAVLTDITYRDEFTNVAFNNNQGSLYWANAWAETDAGGLGVSAGNVRVLAGEARFTVAGSALARGVDFDAIPDSEDIMLTFNFRYTGLAGADTMLVEARESDSASWVTVNTLNGFSGTGSGNRTINLTDLLYDTNPPTATAQIRFRISSGYAVSNYMYIDNVEVSTATDECGYTGVVELDHYAISHSGAGIACLATDITIGGHDVGEGLVEPNETIQLSTSTGKGTWAVVVAGTGALSGAATLTGGADNGIATYEYPTGETQVTLRFNHTVAGVVNINVTGQTSGETESVSHDEDLTVAAAGLRFYNETLSNTSILTQIAGKNSNVAPSSNVLTIQAVRTSNVDPTQCEPIFAAGETLTIGFAAECKDPGSCAAAQNFQINGQNVSLVNDNAGAGASGYTEISIPITTQASTTEAGTIVLNYSDVGQMELHARYDIPFNNDPDETYLSGDYLSGTSSMFIVRPFAFDIDFSDDRQNSGGLSDAVDQTGSAFRIAGQAFDTTVTAVRWQSGDDANNDGVPDAGANLTDNGATPNFDQDTTAGDYSVRVSVIENKVDVAYPAYGVPGVLGTPDFDGFTAGVRTHSMTYDEVGIVDLRADIVDDNDVVTTYKGTSTVEGRVLNVGRFYPNSFAISAPYLTPRADAACSPASTFTYMDEEFEVGLTLTARNIAGVTTQNYHGVYALLDTYGELGMVAYQDRTGLADINLSARLENAVSGGVPATYGNDWVSGVLALSGRMNFARAAAPDGPYAGVEIGLLPTDGDGVTIDPERYLLTATGVLNMNLDNGSNEATGYTRYRLGAAHAFRYGRMIVNNAYGPETEDLALTFEVEYFNGSEFVRNSLDNCSLIDSDELSFNTYTAPLQNGDTTITAGTTTVYAGQTQGVSVNDDPLETSAPGEGNTGTVNLELDLSAATGLNMEYLRFEWDDADDDYNENPQGQIEFGQYRMHDRIINWQEIYNTATP